MLLLKPAFAQKNPSSATLIPKLPWSITNSGDYYITSNLAGPGGITIRANNVTIDLHGFALTGEKPTNSGIYLPASVTNIVVRNGSIRGWNGHGIYAETVNCVKALHLDISSNAFMGMNLGDNCRIDSCTVHDNGTTGILTGTNAFITNTLIRSNLGDGLHTGAKARVLNSSSIANRGSGIIVGGASVVSNCAASQNQQSGIFVNQRGCRIIGNTCVSNNATVFHTAAGIYIFDNNNRIESNRLTDNGNADIFAAPGYTNNMIVSNSVSSGSEKQTE